MVDTTVGKTTLADTTLHPRAGTATDPARWPDVAVVPRPGLRAAIAGKIVERAVRDLPLRLVLEGVAEWGAGTAADPTITVHNPEAFLARIGRHGLIGFGESYMAGEWDAETSEELSMAIACLAANAATLVPATLQRLRALAVPRQPVDKRGWRRASRENIAAHYDLSNEMFASFLDESMTYSSALFDGDPWAAEWDDLRSAQHRKIDRLLDAAGVGNGSHVLEIGTGWGELAIRAAQRGAFVDTVTLSAEQAKLARERVAAAGLDWQVNVHLRDYRDMSGRYDAIVSVEMIEAVGYDQWPTYFRTLDNLLARGGRIGLQAITMDDSRLEASRRTHTWIQKYIFPGGLLLSPDAIERTVAEHTSLTVTDQFSFGQHYAGTLRLWEERFAAAVAQGDGALGLDETFQRMWRFYLCYARAGFEAGYLDVEQFVLERSE